MDRAAAEEMDRHDPLAPLRTRFEIDDRGPLYMDGNSLGRPPREVTGAVAAGLDDWRSRLVSGWDDWIDLPARVGDRVGRLLGAAAGQVLVCDSTTVNLYKLAAAALAARPDRRLIIGDAADFPTDRYVLEGLARATGRRLHLVGTDSTDNADSTGNSDSAGNPAGDAAGRTASLTAAAVAEAVNDDTALVCLSHVNYRSGSRLDVAGITAMAHTRGALVLWDLAHSAGSLPVHLDRWGVDLAVGCTYKYLNSGPGAPGFLYVRRELQGRLRQPIWGWFGRAQQFEMGPGYEPAQGVGSYLTGTPGVLGLLAVDAAAQVMGEAGIDNLWAKSQRLTAMLVGLIDERLAPLGARLATPRRPDQRGAHVSVSHPDAWAWCRTLVRRGLVVPDFRAPDVVRLGPAPIYTRYVDCYDAVERMAEAMASGLDAVGGPGRVT